MMNNLIEPNLFVKFRRWKTKTKKRKKEKIQSRVITLSLGDNDCVILLLLFVVVESTIDDGTLIILCKWDIESTTTFDILSVVVNFIDPNECCWLGIEINFVESIEDDWEEFVALGNVDIDPVVLVDDELFIDVDDDNNVGTKD